MVTPTRHFLPFFSKPLGILDTEGKKIIIIQFSSIFSKPLGILDTEGIKNNNRISIAPYGRNFRGAVGRSDKCSVKV